MDYPLNNQPVTDRYDRMQYKYCGKSGLQLPLISLGLWHNFGSVDNFSVATDMIKYAFDHGITHFDLANNYGPPQEPDGKHRSESAPDRAGVF